MKTTILAKLLVVMLILTLVPLGIMGYLALQDEKAIGMNAANNAQIMGDVAINDSSKALMDLGEKLITQKAIDTAAQEAIYIKANPTKTLSDLQNDTEFQKIAVQKLGDRGYVCTVEYDNKSSIIRFHPNPSLINFDTTPFKEKYPSFWKVVEPTINGTPHGGYYDWPDPDGVTRSKYMYIQPLGVSTADGVMLQSSATTYMEEFTIPSQKLQLKLNSSIQNTVNDIKIATESMSSSNTILLITIISMIIVIIIVCVMAMSISRPIKKLTEIANKISMGDLQTKIDVHTNDEIDDLAESFRRMINAFKIMVSMQEDKEEEEK